MKIIIDRDLCQGHALCVGEVPDVFELDKNGFMRVRIEHPPEALAEQVRLAAKYCPTGSITLIEDE